MKQEKLDQWSSEHGPQTSSFSWELVRNAKSQPRQPHLRPTESETEDGPSNLF